MPYLENIWASCWSYSCYSEYHAIHIKKQKKSFRELFRLLWKFWRNRVPIENSEHSEFVFIAYQYFPCKMGGYSFGVLYRRNASHRGISVSKLGDFITFFAFLSDWWMQEHAKNSDPKADNHQRDILPSND